MSKERWGLFSKLRIRGDVSAITIKTAGAEAAAGIKQQDQNHRETERSSGFFQRFKGSKFTGR